MVNIPYILKLTKKLLYPNGLQTADNAIMWHSLKSIFEFLLEEYQDREYHNLYHLLSGLKFFESEISSGREVNTLVIIAWVAHDALMNEKECAILIKNLIDKTFDKTKLNERHSYTAIFVANLIECTGYYTDVKKLEDKCESYDLFNQLALADLKVLWGNTEDYMQYAQAVRTESMSRYSLSNQEYIEKRSEFLKTYITDGFFPTHPTIKVKESMLHNMSLELDQLTKSKAYYVSQAKQKGPDSGLL